MINPEDIIKPTGSIHSKSTYVLGLDLNRRGADETALVILEKPFTSDKVFVCYIETHNYSKLTEAIGRVLSLNALFEFSKIYLDSTGLGSGVCDVLKEKIPNGIVEEVIFTRKSKPEMFNNLKLLMQQGKLKFPNYLETENHQAKKLYFQFLSIQQEFTSDSEVPKIYHEDNTHDDIVCALALAALHFSPRRQIRRGYGLASVS
jgi:phage FluMu gp28-like protein